MVQDKGCQYKGSAGDFTTHDVMLLDLNFFRRDQILFAEKNDKGLVQQALLVGIFLSRKRRKCA